MKRLTQILLLAVFIGCGIFEPDEPEKLDYLNVKWVGYYHTGDYSLGWIAHVRKNYKAPEKYGTLNTWNYIHLYRGDRYADCGGTFTWDLEGKNYSYEEL